MHRFFRRQYLSRGNRFIFEKRLGLVLQSFFSRESVMYPAALEIISFSSRCVDVVRLLFPPVLADVMRTILLTPEIWKNINEIHSKFSN